LINQLGQLAIPPEQLRILRILVANLDENGYLKLPLEELRQTKDPS